MNLRAELRVALDPEFDDGDTLPGSELADWAADEARAALAGRSGFERADVEGAYEVVRRTPPPS